MPNANFKIMIKICSKCKQEKLLSDFNKDLRLKSGVRSICSKCREIFRFENKERINLAQLESKNRYPWTKTYNYIQQRCENPKQIGYKSYGGRGIQCKITSEELKKLWFRDKAYFLEQPSIDRINCNSDYTFDNCRYIELDVNKKRERRIRNSSSPAPQFLVD